MKRVVLLVALVTVAGCPQKRSEGTRGSPPLNAYFIGPQPGTDRAFTTPVNPFTDDPAARLEGRKLFKNMNCAGCHGDHAGGGMGPSLRDSLWYYGGKPENIFASITEGRKYGMPAWGSKLPAEQIWKIVTYIGSLRTAQEPEAPH
jgi:mono/diheme cytochrome c family protein